MAFAAPGTRLKAADRAITKIRAGQATARESPAKRTRAAAVDAGDRFNYSACKVNLSTVDSVMIPPRSPGVNEP